MEFETSLLLSFIATNAALNFTPGPAVLKVVSDSMSNGVLRSHASMFGVFTANLMYAFFAVLGMSSLIVAFPEIFEVIKWFGVSYLIYMAIGNLKAAFSAQGGQAQEVQPSSLKKLFWTSFAMQGANPKSVLFFCAMLPVFAGAGDGIEMRMIILALVAIALEYPALLLYSALGAQAKRFAVGGKSVRAMKLFSATALGGAATMIARTSLSNR
ncbi:MAG: LysE family translocator [Methylocystaceae bacterium]|nr:LysE family translocator [Methylocystaceae bacterium]